MCVCYEGIKGVSELWSWFPKNPKIHEQAFIKQVGENSSVKQWLHQVSSVKQWLHQQSAQWSNVYTNSQLSEAMFTPTVSSVKQCLHQQSAQWSNDYNSSQLSEAMFTSTVRSVKLCLHQQQLSEAMFASSYIINNKQNLVQHC